MLSHLQDFFTRHRRKFIVTGIIVGGSFFAIKYAQRKLAEFQDRHAREFLEKSRRMQHFDSTERTCNQVIIGMGTELFQAILRECSTESLLEQLRQNPTNKLELWEEIKIIAFTRLTTFVYASAMLVIALRVQLNLLGGYVYRDITTEEQAISDELKQQYLSLIRHFLHEGGLSDLVRLIRTKVVALLKPLPLTKPLSLSDLEQLFWSLQMAINGDGDDPNTKMSRYLLTERIPNAGGPLLQKMYNETLDLLESDDASTVCSNNICRGFSLAIDAIAESLGESLTTPSNISENLQEGMDASKQNNNDLLNINNVQLALAKVIPIVSGITSKGFDGTTRPPNFATSLITFFVVSEKSKVLGSNVYETFSSS